MGAEAGERNVYGGDAVKQLCYKVVKVEQGRFYSTNADKDLKTEYKVDRWVSAPVGGLLVFEFIEDAISFAKDSKHAIFTCEVLHRVPMPKMHATWDIKYLLKLWEDAYSRRHGRDGWPKGSKAFRLVKLVEKMNLTETEQKEQT